MGGRAISATLVLLNMLGAIALLLWGMRMVRTGVTRAYGSSLRTVLGRHLDNRFTAFFSGLGITAVLQSSTATCLMTASFASRGLVATTAALAVMLGADVGTTLVAQVFTLDISWLSPVFIVAGLIAFHGGRRKRIKDLGRLGIGLGLMLLALKLLVGGSEPIRESETVLVVVTSLAEEPVLAILVAALLTWLAHSSLAVVLLICSMVGAGAVPLALALPLVLGANLGGTMPPVTATLASAPVARRVALGNVIFKLAGCIAILPVLQVAGGWIAVLDSDPVRQVVNFHTAFNVALALVFILLTDLVTRLTERFLPDRAAVEDEATPRYLDPAARAEPAIALACAARETLRMADTLDVMLGQSIEVLKDNDRDRLDRVSEMDDTVDSLYEAIKLYLTDVSREPLEEEESRRCSDIMAFMTNLEHIGDIVDKNLMELAAKKIKYQLQFSGEGLAEIETLHGRVRDNLQLATSVFVSGDQRLARKLLQEKDHFRDLERGAAESHHERLKDGVRETIETSSLHLDILRDLKRINSHITSAAYPILEEAGELRPSRLRMPESEA
ncbi:MAG: Na/Pi cotransporter family protein [Alphaproteobacteria bacterium]|nr:Na/Pi cotransporter family protein [Alphaproteobacteria bacterium]